MGEPASRSARIARPFSFALNEPEGYLRVYLDEGEPMKEALQALLTPHSRQYEWAASTRAYVAKLLVAFEQEQGARNRISAAPTLAPVLSSLQQSPPASLTPGGSLTRREQEVLRLLAAGASNQDIAQARTRSLL